jgi:hypothetical protein
MISVQRFVARVKPHRRHKQNFEWQTAVACIFVGDEDRERAQQRAEREIRIRCWERIEFIERSTLIEERVRIEGGAVLEAFLQAQASIPFYLDQLDEIPFSTKEKPLPILAPRLTESFIDQVVRVAGGSRIDTDRVGPNRPKTADYRLGRLILELKDLQSEGLDIDTRQAKIAELFSSKLRPDRSVIVDPAILTPDERRQYLDIVGQPVRKRLVEAGRQVRCTLDRAKDRRLRGGAILLNTGYGSLPHDVLVRIASNYVAQSNTITTAVCISAWTVTNGFDTVLSFAFHPLRGGPRPVVKLRNTFWAEVQRSMTEWGRDGFKSAAPTSDPLRPIVFEIQSGLFSLVPSKPPTSVGWSSAFDARGT